MCNGPPNLEVTCFHAAIWAEAPESVLALVALRTSDVHVGLAAALPCVLVAEGAGGKVLATIATLAVIGAKVPESRFARTLPFPSESWDAYALRCHGVTLWRVKL